METYEVVIIILASALILVYCTKWCYLCYVKSAPDGERNAQIARQMEINRNILMERQAQEAAARENV